MAQEKQLGTAHALLMASDRLGGDDFLVLAGDNLIDAKTVFDLLDKHDGPSIVVTESEMPSKYGVTKVEGGRVVAIEEKPQWRMGNIISTGIYYFTPDMLKHFDQETLSRELGITQVLKPILQDVKVSAVFSSGKWIDAVYPWDLIEVNAAALDNKGNGINGVVESGVTIKGAVTVGLGSRIRSGCYIEGPVSIGEGCDIGPNVTIQASTSIGDAVTIEPFTLISNSVIMRNVRIGSHSHLSNSVIDEGVKVRAGLFAASSSAYTRVDREFFKLSNIGALIGEDTSIGSRVVISPGSIIGAGCRVEDGVRLNGNLENKSVVV